MDKPRNPKRSSSTGRTRSKTRSKANPRFDNSVVAETSGGPKINTTGSVVPTQKASVAYGTWSSNYRAGFDNGITEFSNPTNYPDGPFQSDQGMVQFTADEVAKRTPSGAVLWTTHTFGSNPDRSEYSSAINQSAFKLKQFIDTKLGQRTSYQPQDVALYIMAVADVIERITEVKRAITLVNNAAAYPSFFPNGVYDLLKICAPRTSSSASYDTTIGLAAQDAAAHTNVYTDTLNLFINQLNTLPMPAELPILTINNDLFSAIYADSSDVANSQLYLFASNGYWVYNETRYSNGACIQFERWGENFGDAASGFKSIPDMLHAIQRQLNLITTNSEASALMQDLYNAYGTGALLRIDYLQPDSIVPLEFNENMLISIENATIANGCAFCDIVADTLKGITGAPMIPAYDTYLSSIISLPLQFHTAPEVVTDEMIAHALRFHPSFLAQGKWNQNFNGTAELNSCFASNGMYGFAVVTSFDISIYNGMPSGANSKMFEKLVITDRNQGSWPVTNAFGDFNHAPLLVNMEIRFSGGEGKDRVRTLILHSYSAKRDTEITVNRGFLEQWFRGFCENAWSTDITRASRGQREVLG